jgi:hypothetical protein
VLYTIVRTLQNLDMSSGHLKSHDETLRIGAFLFSGWVIRWRPENDISFAPQCVCNCVIYCLSPAQLLVYPLGWQHKSPETDNSFSLTFVATEVDRVENILCLLYEVIHSTALRRSWSNISTCNFEFWYSFFDRCVGCSNEIHGRTRMLVCL